MAKDYNIDDILSEVKKRRCENENQIIASPADVQEDATPQESAQEIQAETQQETIPTEEKIEETVTESQEIEQEIEQEIAEEQAQVDIDDQFDKESCEQIAANARQKAKITYENEGYINVLDYADSYGEDFNQAEYDEVDQEALGKTKKSKGKIIAIIIAVVLVVVAVAGVVIGNQVLNLLTDDNTQATTESQWAGMDANVENFAPFEETDASQISSFKDMVKTWYYNGSPCSSSKVLNVLLIGEDTRGTEILDDGTRADAAIICSVNTQTKQITLTSVLRDTYAYYESTEGDETTGEFGKINGAMHSGDINSYINAIECLYKIKIDNYAIVNFQSFEKIVDAIGGVTLELTKAEINEINNHPKRYGNVYIEKDFEGNSGLVTLNGEQALAYCRIRKIDSDTVRADRQKTCLLEIFNGVKNASGGELIKVATNLLPYVKTGFSKSEVLDIAKYALTQGWLSYSTQTCTVPASRINEKGAGGTFYGAWCWKSDFAQDAYDLQMRIYGKSNITLAKTRVDFINVREQGFFADGDSATTATIPNQNYGIPTTTQASTKADE